MSVASRNPFALLGDEDGPSPAAPIKTVKAEDAAPKRAVVGAGVSNGPRGGGAGSTRGGRGGGARGGRVAADAGGAAADEDAPAREARGAIRGAPRGGRGEGRGGRGGRGGGRGRGRAFDRHSMTGKEDTAKNIHQGWGGDDPKRELDVDEKARADAAEEGEATLAGEGGTPAATSNGEAVIADATSESKPEVVEEEKDNTKTLDEYLAEQAEKRAQIGARKEARPAAAADLDALGKRLEKQDSEDYYKIQKERNQRQREKKEKQVLEIEQTYNTPPAARGGGERGRGRGGDRGRGDRGRGAGRGRGFGDRGSRGGFERARGRGGRGGSSGGANLNLSDDSAFPTLG